MKTYQIRTWFYMTVILGFTVVALFGCGEISDIKWLYRGEPFYMDKDIGTIRIGIRSDGVVVWEEIPQN